MYIVYILSMQVASYIKVVFVSLSASGAIYHVVPARGFREKSWIRTWVQNPGLSCFFFLQGPIGLTFGLLSRGGSYTAWGGCIVEPPNSGHIGGRDLVLYREVIPNWWLTSKPHTPIPKVESIEKCVLREVKSVILCRNIQNLLKTVQID